MVAQKDVKTGDLIPFRTLSCADKNGNIGVENKNKFLSPPFGIAFVNSTER